MKVHLLLNIYNAPSKPVQQAFEKILDLPFLPQVGLILTLVNTYQLGTVGSAVSEVRVLLNKEDLIDGEPVALVTLDQLNWEDLFQSDGEVFTEPERYWPELQETLSAQGWTTFPGW